MAFLVTLLAGFSVDAVRRRETRLFASGSRIDSLMRTEYIYKTLLCNYPNSVIILFDKEGRMPIAAGEALPRTGMSRQMLEGKLIDEAFPEDIIPFFHELHSRGLNGEKFNFRSDFNGASFSSRVIPIENAREEIEYILLISEDITEVESYRSKLELSMKRLQDLQESSDQLIYEIDSNAIFTTVSDRLCETLGYSRQELQSITALEIISPKDMEWFIEFFQEASRKLQTIFGLEYRVRSKEGKDIWFSVNGIPIIDAKGKFGGWRGTCQDITAQKERQRLLHLFEKTISQIQDAVYIKDIHGSRVFSNRAWHDLHGSGAICIDNIEISPDPNTHGKLAETQLPENHSWHIGADGEKFIFESTETEIKDDKGQKIATAVVGRDVTEQMRREAERNTLLGELMDVNDMLEELAAKLQQSNADLEEFTHVVSHDLQEPLRMVASYVELLRRRYQGRLDGDADEFIQFAIDGVERMQALIQGLLGWSRVDKSRRKLKEVSLSDVLDTSIKNLSFSIGDKNASITTCPLPKIQGDYIQLIQLFQNIIGNAVKYNESQIPEVIISSNDYPDSIHIAIKDNGIGIPEDQRDKVWGVFQRLHGREAFEGTGIGLSITKKIVERHWGRIWIEDNQPNGTIFNILLPKKQPSNKAA